MKSIFSSARATRSLSFAAALVCLACLTPAAVSAQAVEMPIAFDSVGRITAITPAMAARLELRPPAWRITGYYREARLYSLGSGSYVIVVTRGDGTVERYSITEEDRFYLMQRTSTLPSGAAEQFTRVARGAERQLRSSQFVRDQTLLGLFVYAPAVAVAISDDDAGRFAAWLIASGATFFTASEVARSIPISTAQNALSTDVAMKGAFSGWGITYALDGNQEMRAAATLAGGVGGTALGLYFGRNMTEGEAVATGFGSDALILTAVGVITAIDATASQDVDTRTAAGVLVGAALAGYPIGNTWYRRADYNITPGDVLVLYVTGAIGAAVANIPIPAGEQYLATRWAAGTAGMVAGFMVGDRLLVRRFDHTRGDAGMTMLGAGAGGLMGLGVYVLLDREQSREQLALALGSAGAVAGVALAERYSSPAPDAGRLSWLEVNPAGLAAAAAGVRGNHPLVTITFR